MARRSPRRVPAGPARRRARAWLRSSGVEAWSSTTACTRSSCSRVSNTDGTNDSSGSSFFFLMYRLRPRCNALGESPSAAAAGGGGRRMLSPEPQTTEAKAPKAISVWRRDAVIADGDSSA
ncbi:hypothetical protein CLOM_g1033 [Closterium sp. NIES-68]|nr:hypothetical protein CLOM_g1033 [Closterium sp. NIES-68]GJP71653.1 hypothetical protein CLOP_g2466 [Closterium sp. NIES-67]